jgi:hypothetical protein
MLAWESKFETRRSKLERKGRGLESCGLLGGFKEGALAARVFVGAKGSSNLPPRAQRRIWAGQSQRWKAQTLLLSSALPEKTLADF